MTAEIAIMNKSAVALAADSAVTFGNRDQQKIYNTVHKLFSLSKYHPVGAMVFGGAELMGVPWETVIKMYRQHLGKRAFPTLKNYVDDFIKFIEKSNSMFPPEAQVLYVGMSASTFFQKVREDIKIAVEKALKGKSPLSTQQISNIAANIIEGMYNHVNGRPDIVGGSEKRQSQIKDLYTSIIEQQKTKVFEKLPLSEKSSTLLTEIGCKLCTKDMFNNFSTSGLVLAGFGGDEIFPSLTQLSVDIVTAGFLKQAVRSHVQMDRHNHASIIPFAQKEMVQTFMEGVNPSYHTSVSSYLQEMFEQYPARLLQAIPRMSEKRKRELLKGLQGVGKQFFADFTQKMEQYRKAQHVGPIMNAMAALPKDELAAVAESLVNLTSFKRRFSMEAETVGGPIDVAVISKGDGFVWIKRKHYFRPELNPHYFSNYFREYTIQVKGDNDAQAHEEDTDH